MGKPRKGKKNGELTLEAITEAIEGAVDPIKTRLDALEKPQNGDEQKVTVEEEDLKEFGVDTPEELEGIIDAAVDIAIESLEEDGEVLAAAIAADEVDTGEIVDELTKSRKARKFALKKGGKEDTLEDVTPEEVAEIIEDIVLDEAEGKTDEEIEDLAKEDLLSDDEVKSILAIRAKKQGMASHSSKRSRKSDPANRQQRRTKSSKASTPRIQRKHASIYVKQNGPASREENLPPEVKFARAVKCADPFFVGGGATVYPDQAAFIARQRYGDANLEKAFKSMSVTQPSSAGVLVPRDYMDEIIPMLYDATFLMELGAQKIPMPHGNITIPKQRTGSIATFGGEGRNIDATQPTFEELMLNAKRLQAIVIMTEELMLSTEYSADQLFANDLLTQMRLGIEYSALFGTGTKYAPMGLAFNPDVTVIDLSDASLSVEISNSGAPGQDLPIHVRGVVRSKNVIGQNLGWVFNADAEQKFMRIKDNEGRYVWKEEMETRGTLNGVSYRVTNMIETDTSKKTQLFFGNWSDFFVAEQFGLETRTSYDATIPTGTNSAIHTFASVQTATRATSYLDMGIRYEESFVVVDNVIVDNAD